MKALSLAIAAAIGIAALPASAADLSNLMVRARAVNLDMANKSDAIAGVAPADAITVNDKTIPEVDLTWFFTPNVSAELILTYPQKQTVHSSVLNADAGTFKHLPPTLTLQYHVTGLGGFRPYVGAGVNFTNLSAVHLDAASTALGATVNLKRNSVGLALQAGVDIPLGGGWLLNADVKKVQIGTKVLANDVSVGKFKVDPVLVGIGIGKRF